ncbi:MAG: TRAP transporter substrate-binding protein [Sphaerochaetaceae bacterium]|nr:TRAP transporter substrate-binding protein [Sphaerochaetaceae bacterium]
MKKVLAILLVALLATTFIFANASTEATSTGETKKPEMILRYAENNNATDERALACEHFAELIKERTNGRIEIQVYPGGQLGGSKDVIQSLQLGAIDMCNEPSSNLTGWGCNIEYLDIISLPFMFRDVDHAVAVMDGEIGQGISKAINESGFGIIALDHFVAGARNIFTNKPITKLSDIKGLKIRVQQSAIYIDTFKAFGASPTPLDNSEVYSGIQTGVIDGAENPVKGYLNNKFYEVAKYYSWSNYLIQPSTMFISQITWNRLSDADKEIFKQAAAETTEWFQELTASKLDGQIKTLSDAGVIFTELEDYDAWVAAVAPLYEKYAKYNDMIEKIKAVK